MKTNIEMAEKAGFQVDQGALLRIYLEHFAALVRADERESCAGLRKELVLLGDHPTEYEEGFWDALAKYEDVIRAKGNI